jgi:coenzyme A diphosphatase NUDT7
MNSAVLVLLVEIQGQYYFLLEKRSRFIRQAGEICFPGGKYDRKLDQNFLDTALRETREEIGIPRENINVLGQLDTVLSFGGILVEGFLAEISFESMGPLNLNEREVEKTILIPVQYFIKNEPEVYKVKVTLNPTCENEEGEKIILFPTKALGLGEMYCKPWGNYLSSVYVYHYENEVIWGITARFILDVVNKIKGSKKKMNTIKSIIQEDRSNYKDLSCAEKILYAANEAYDLNLDGEALKLAAGFGGGMGIESVCGALTAGIMAIGKLYTEDRAHTSPKVKELSQQFLNTYKEKMDSLLCNELKAKHANPEIKCKFIILEAAELLDEVIQKEMA